MSKHLREGGFHDYMHPVDEGYRPKHRALRTGTDTPYVPKHRGMPSGSRLVNPAYKPKHKRV
jgi:hypothetical protein